MSEYFVYRSEGNITRDLEDAIKEFVRNAEFNLGSWTEGVERSDRLVKITYRQTLFDKILSNAAMFEDFYHTIKEEEIMSYTLPAIGWKSGYA